MSVVGPPLAFIPPVVVLPAASAVVPAVAGAAATAVALPTLPLVGAVVAGGVVAGLAALAIGAAVNGQLWGYLNGPGGVSEPGNWLGPVDQPIENATVIEGGRNGAGLMYPVPGPDAPNANPGPYVPDNASVSAYFVHVGSPGSVPYGWVYRVQWTQDGIMQTEHLRCGPGSAICHDNADPSTPPTYSVLGWRYTADDAPVPEVTPIYPVPAPRPPVPEPEPLPEPQRLPAQPTPLPPVVPAVPNADPVPPPASPPGTPTTTPATRPATQPEAPPVPGPLPVSTPKPNAQPTENGVLVPQAPPPPVKTPVDAHVVNGQPINSPGPQPTPQGIAQELGRVEKKLAQLLSPKEGSAADRLGLLDDKLDLLRLVWELITSLTAGGQYTLSSPCELDEAGQRIVKTVQYGGATSALGVISNKLDAVADLLQEHKDLKQPICRQPPPVGQPVTVNFVQTD